MMCLLKKILFILVYAFTAQASFAQHPLIWQVQKNTIEFWVTGITHSVPENQAAPPAVLFQIYEKASVVYPESNFDTRPINLPPLAETDELLAWPIFEKLVKDKILPSELASALNKLPAHTLQEKLNQVLLLTRTPSSTKFVEGYDAYFARKAHSGKDKKLAQLEDRSRRKELWAQHCGSTNDYLRLVKAMDYKLRNPASTETLIPEVNAAVLSGNIDSIKLVHEKIGQDILYKILLECSASPRNFEWAKKVSDNPSEFNNSMILVGAAHVVGKDNFIELLEKQGFKATLIKAPQGSGTASK